MATLFEQIRGRLTPAQQSWLVGVWGPMSLYVMGLKGWRVAGLDGPASWWTLVILERSELFLCLAVLLVGFGLFCLARSRNTTRVVGIGLQLVAVVVVVANTVSHQFFMSTGSTMDGSLFWFGVDHFMNERHVISSEVPAATLAMLAGSVVYVAAVPPWLAYRRRHSDDDERASAPRHMAAAVALAAAVVFVGVAALPPIGVDQSTGFVREPTLEIGLTSLFEQSQGRAAGSAMMFETADAHLEETDATVRKNIALIVLESTRATATSIYDGDHQTTPYLKSLAESSVVMDDAYAVMPHTSKALVAILCGIPPRPTMRIVEAVPGNIPGQCLPQLLAEQGYRSVFWQAATAGFEHRTKLISRLGFDDFYPIESLDTNGFKKVNYFGYEDDVMVEPSRRWLKKHADKPFLATYMTLTTHHDYGAPPRYGHVDYANAEMFNRYLNAVHYLDNFVHNIIRQYKQLGLYDSTIFVVLGDHGRGLASMGANNTTTSSIKKGSMCRGLSTRPGVRRSRLPSSGPSISSTWCPR